MLPAIVGSEIAEMLWPFIKAGAIMASVLGVVGFILRATWRLGNRDAEVTVLKESEDARSEFEKQRARRRDEALARLRERRARQRVRPPPGADGDDA